jgi:hypothetical protein
VTEPDDADGWLGLGNRALIDPIELVDAMLAGFGGGLAPVDPRPNVRDFVDHYALRIDGRPFDVGPMGLYSHLQTPYEDTHLKKVAIAGAQTGKSAWLIANLARDMAGPAWGQMMGYYFPDAHLPIAFARDRFKPFMKSNPILGKHLGVKQVIRGGKGTDNELTMSWGETVLFFMTIGGKTATEGLPLKAIYFDEVRRMSEADISLAEERTSAQGGAINFKVSTAKFENSDIHKYYLEGDQRYYHTACKCAEGCVLALTFPNCIADLRTATPALKRKVAHAFSHAGLPELGIMTDGGETYPAAYMCAKCGEILVNPRDGWWEPHAPQNYAHSYQFPQMLSWTYPAARMLYKFEHAISIQEIYNSGCGLPYRDPETQKLRKEELLACVNNDLEWGEHMTAPQRRRRLVNCGMGVDVQAGYLCAVIKVASSNGKHRTVHVAVVHGDNPNDPSQMWEELGKLMQRYDVACCVLDAMPEMSAARTFANAFYGRVWLQDYSMGEDTGKLVEWPEDTLSKDRKQKDPEVDFKFRVRMDRTAVLEWGVMRWVNRVNELPNPNTLVQSLPLQGGKVVLAPYLRLGVRAPVPVCVDPYFDHLPRWAFRDLMDDATTPAEKLAQRTGKKRRVAEWVGQDPHFSHADTWASIAVGRSSRRSEPRRP